MEIVISGGGGGGKTNTTSTELHNESSEYDEYNYL